MTQDEWNSRSSLTVGAQPRNVSKVWIQHLGACVACISAFAVGTTLGWSSPAGAHILRGDAGFEVSESQNSLIGSLLTVGAAVSCLPSGYITDRIGRKKTLLSLVPVFLLGWGLIIWATSVGMLCAGRVCLGLCAGTVCVTAPVYAAEISQKEIRGAAGSYFQLLLAGGILFVYVIGSQLDVLWFSAVCGAVPIVFGITFVFFPETPVYHLTKGDREAARKSLQFFRGRSYDFEPELYELSEYSRHEHSEGESTWRAFASKPSIKSLGMSIGMMVFQQMNGINAFIFNATDIFEHAGSPLEAKYETIIIGVMQVAGTLAATFLVDRLGRIMLLGSSACFMSACTFFLGLYFYLKEHRFEVDDFSWLPVASLCIFIIMFTIGFGSVPWMLMPELIPSRIKGLSSSIACFFNWLAAFVVTEFFNNLIHVFGSGITFWIFAGVSAVAAVFSYKVLPETKGKSFEEIQRELAGSPPE